MFESIKDKTWIRHCKRCGQKFTVPNKFIKQKFCEDCIISHYPKNPNNIQKKGFNSYWDEFIYRNGLKE